MGYQFSNLQLGPLPPTPPARKGAFPVRHYFKPALFLMASLIIAIGLKLHYRQATPGELAWILAPTTALVHGVTRTEFEFETGAGWISRSRAFVIAPQCAGINFLIITLLSLGLITLMERPGRCTFGWGAAALLIAYMATVTVNALRIILALEALPIPWIPWLSPAEQHRWAGVATYLSGLWITTRMWQRICPPRSESDPAGVGCCLGRWGGCWVWIPPIVYILVALGIPLIRAFPGGLAPHFGAHFITVATGVVFVWGGFFLVHRRLASHFRESIPHHAGGHQPGERESIQTQGSAHAWEHINRRR